MKALDWNIYVPTPHTIGWLIMSACTPQVSAATSCTHPTMHPLCRLLMRRFEQVLESIIKVEFIYTDARGIDSYQLTRMVFDECLLAERAFSVHSHNNNSLSAAASGSGTRLLLPEMNFILLQNDGDAMGRSVRDEFLQGRIRMLARHAFSSPTCTSSE